MHVGSKCFFKQRCGVAGSMRLPVIGGVTVALNAGSHLVYLEDYVFWHHWYDAHWHLVTFKSGLTLHDLPERRALRRLAWVVGCQISTNLHALSVGQVLFFGFLLGF